MIVVLLLQSAVADVTITVTLATDTTVWTGNEARYGFAIHNLIL